VILQGEEKEGSSSLNRGIWNEVKCEIGKWDVSFK